MPPQAAVHRPTLTTLHRVEFPGDDYVTVLVRIENPGSALVGRHTHPGLEMTTLLQGEATLMVDGRPDQPMSPGDWFQVPAGGTAQCAHGRQAGGRDGDLRGREGQAVGLVGVTHRNVQEFNMRHDQRSA
jgi:hypothetical protein